MNNGFNVKHFGCLEKHRIHPIHYYYSCYYVASRGSSQQSLPAFDATVRRQIDDATLTAAESPRSFFKTAVQDSRLGDLGNPKASRDEVKDKTPPLTVSASPSCSPENTPHFFCSLLQTCRSCSQCDSFFRALIHEKLHP